MQAEAIARALDTPVDQSGERRRQQRHRQWQWRARVGVRPPQVCRPGEFTEAAELAEAVAVAIDVRSVAELEFCSSDVLQCRDRGGLVRAYRATQQRRPAERDVRGDEDEGAETDGGGAHREVHNAAARRFGHAEWIGIRRNGP